MRGDYFVKPADLDSCIIKAKYARLKLTSVTVEEEESAGLVVYVRNTYWYRSTLVLGNLAKPGLTCAFLENVRTSINAV
jgi:hypothetical protein